MICFDKITDLFCITDEFCKNFEKTTESFLIGNKPKKKPRMSTAEVITIYYLFHLSGFRCFKHFYLFYVQKHMQNEFPNTVSYNRFVELMQSVLLPMTMFAKTCCLGNCTGISFVDSTPIRVCGTKRIKRNKVFKDIATTGKSTMGWFHGFKLHIVINDKGEILSFCVTQANVDDRDPLKNERFLKDIFGKLFGDKGYISKELHKLLFVDGVELITSIKNNMKRSNYILFGLLAFFLILGGYGCNSYNSMVDLDTDVEKSWSNVEAQYQRRADLIEKLAKVVVKAAKTEENILKEVTS
jgi:hypothetical protein